MRTLLVGICIVFLTAGTALAGKPQPQPEPATGNMELVGFTTVTTAPNIGLFGMTQLCQAEYLDSRICTSKEIMETVNVPLLPSGTRAWLQPVVAGVNTSGIVTDISGQQYYSLSCGNWQSIEPTSRGLSVTNLGSITMNQCSSILPVACCAPAQ